MSAFEEMLIREKARYIKLKRECIKLKRENEILKEKLYCIENGLPSPKYVYKNGYWYRFLKGRELKKFLGV